MAEKERPCEDDEKAWVWLKCHWLGSRAKIGVGGRLTEGVRLPSGPAADCTGAAIERVSGTVPGLAHVLVDRKAALERIGEIMGSAEESGMGGVLLR
mmetsp:Transcript_686/g.2437  ORF Transcript_686/g.2437 Transcript_686/m.2437 type:complete len:97 (-) Transcript_686:774-1064(-)